MKRSLALILAAIFVLMSFTACNLQDWIPTGEKLRINVPEEVIQAEIGSYDLPKFDVVNEENLIKAGYEVIVKKVIDPNGNEVTVAYNKINAIVPGVYTVTYGVADGKVNDATLKIDFADRTAPTLDMKEDALPKYYIQGMKYALPVYTLAGEPDYDACYIKVYYMAELGGEKTEVEVVDSYFTVEYNVGVYQILIHAEDAAGNVKEYTFNVEATGPSEVVEGKIIYSDEPFGVSQLSFLWNVWSMEYSTEMAWGNEAGSIKVTAEGGATDYLILSKLIQRDVTTYDELVIRIYNANDYEVFTGCAWFGDTVLEPNAWTEVVLSLDDLNRLGSHPAVQGLKPTSQNLENLAIRFWTDYTTNTLEAGSELYISAMYARVQEITGPSEVKDDVVAYYDEVWGSLQGGFFWGDCNKQEFVTDVKYGDEAGSLKITCLKDNQGWNYYILKNPSITNITKYDYIEFYVYNPTEKDFVVQLLWGGDTTCKAGEWTRVKFPVSLITNGVTDVNNKPIPATDITNLTMCIWTTDMLKGDCFYFSQMRGGYEPEVLPDNLITNFDGATGLNPFNGTSSVEFVNDIKFGDEKGALKITANQGGEHYVSIISPLLSDVSSYDYIVFRVYTEKDITAGLLWCADTVCKAGEWTEIRVPVSFFAEGKVTDFSKALSANDIRGISLRVFTGLEAGESVYVSSMFAMKEEKPAHSCEHVCAECGKCLDAACADAACADKCTGHEVAPEPTVQEDLISKLDKVDELNPFNGCVGLEYVTDVKYGEEEGSLKITANLTGEMYISILKPVLKDVSSYEYVSFRVYNPNSYDITVGTMWWSDTVCKAGEWTEVRIELSAFTNGKVDAISGADVLPNDVTGLSVRIVGSMTVGDVIYVSNVVAVKEVVAEVPHACEHVCAECGKCLDADCADAVCADKCAGHEVAPEPEIRSDVIIGVENLGVSIVWGDPHKVSLSAEKVFGSEAASMKVEMTATNGWNYLRLETPAITDISSYEAIEFYVYNATSSDFVFGLLWCGDTNCKAGEWTKVTFPVALLANVTDMAGKKIEATDITGLDFIFYSGGSVVGESFYISSIKAVGGEAPEVTPDPEPEPEIGNYEDVVSRLDGALNPFNGCAGVEYVTDVKYGEEEGSLKITSKTGGDLYISILNPVLKNVASYEYIAFRVYNPTDKVIKAGVLWWADTDCAPGEWTEIKVPVADIVAGKITDFGAALPATNITGFSLRIISGLDTDASVYVSHVVAVKAKGEEVKGGVADLGTLTNPEGSSEGSYLERTSDAGWHVVWARSDEEATFGHSYDMITINGRTDRVGIVTSPYIRGGISKLSFGYGYAYTENGIISLTVNIIVDGKIVATNQVYGTGLEKCVNYEFVWELEEPIEGSFMIQIVNNCPTGSTSNKDRIGIWNIAWE